MSKKRGSDPAGRHIDHSWISPSGVRFNSKVKVLRYRAEIEAGGDGSKALRGVGAGGRGRGGRGGRGRGGRWERGGRGATTAAASVSGGIGVSGEPEGTWVACDKCGKWREVPDRYFPLAENWYCELNPVLEYSSCDVPEQVRVVRCMPRGARPHGGTVRRTASPRGTPLLWRSCRGALAISFYRHVCAVSHGGRRGMRTTSGSMTWSHRQPATWPGQRRRHSRPRWSRRGSWGAEPPLTMATTATTATTAVATMRAPLVAQIRLLPQMASRGNLESRRRSRRRHGWRCERLSTRWRIAASASSASTNQRYVAPLGVPLSGAAGARLADGRRPV